VKATEEKILELFTVFVDTCHHGREEKFPFPALVPVRIPKKGTHGGVMCAEYDQGRGFVKAVEHFPATYKTSDIPADVSLVMNTGSYIQLLTQYIHQEENVAL